MARRIPALSPAELTDGQRDALSVMRNNWGEPWNIGLTMIHSPGVTRGFLGFRQAIDRAGLNKMDREVICFEMAAADGCHYGIPAHRMVAKSRGLDLKPLERIAAGELLEGTDRPEVLQRLVRRLFATRGGPDDAEFTEARSVFSDAELVAIVAGIAHCMFMNTRNRLARIGIDPFLPTTPAS